MSTADDWVYLEFTDLPREVAAPATPLPPSISLRAVKSVADLEGVADLVNAAFDSDDENAVSFEQAAKLAWHPGPEIKQSYLAFDGDLPVGVGVGCLIVPVAGEPLSRGIVELLAVRPQYWHQGIGSNLLHAVLSWLAEKGVSIVSSNLVDPIPLSMLERVGFSPTEPDTSTARHVHSMKTPPGACS